MGDDIMTIKITDYGKLLRNLRMNSGELLKHMADKLGMSSSYLSAIENGKRSIPHYLTDKISKIYNLDRDSVRALRAAERKSIREITLNLESSDEETQDIAIAFAKKLNTLDKKTINALKQYLK